MKPRSLFSLTLGAVTLLSAALVQAQPTAGLTVRSNGTVANPTNFFTANRAAAAAALATNFVAPTDPAMTNSRPPTGSASGDLVGQYPGPTVVALRGRPISASEVTPGQIMQWNGTEWFPVTIAVGGFDPAGNYTASGVWLFTGQVTNTGPVYVENLYLLNPLGQLYGGTGGTNAASSRTALGLRINQDIMQYYPILATIGQAEGVPGSVVQSGIDGNNITVNVVGEGRTVKESALVGLGGSGGNSWFVTNRYETTSAGTVVLATNAIPLDSTVKLEVEAMAAGSTHAGEFTWKGLFANRAGSLVTIGTTNYPTLRSTNGIDISVTSLGTNVIFNVTGIADPVWWEVKRRWWTITNSLPAGGGGYNFNTHLPLAWWRPETLSGANGTAVTRWVDSSGNGNDLVGVAPTAPLLTNNFANGFSAVTYDGVDDFLQVTNRSGLDILTDSTGMTMFLVMQVVESGSTFKSYMAVQFGEGTATNRFLANKASASAQNFNIRRVAGDPADTSLNASLPTPGTVWVNTFRYNATSASMQAYSNAVTTATMSDSTYGTAGTTGPSPGTMFRIGAGPTTYLNMRLVEGLAFKGPLDVPTRETIMTQLALKHGK